MAQFDEAMLAELQRRFGNQVDPQQLAQFLQSQTLPENPTEPSFGMMPPTPATPEEDPRIRQQLAQPMHAETLPPEQRNFNNVPRAEQQPAVEWVPTSRAPQGQPQQSQEPGPSFDQLREYDRLTQQRANAIERQGLLESKTNQELKVQLQQMAAEERRLADENRQKEAQRSEVLAKAESALQEEINQLGDMRINPGRWWSSLTKGKKVSQMLGLAIGSVAGPVNQFAIGLQNQINDDIALQKEDLRRKQGKIQAQAGLYAKMFQRFQNEYAADLAAQSAYLQSFTKELEAIKAGGLSEQASIRADQLIADLSQEAMLKRQKLADAIISKIPHSTGDPVVDQIYARFPDKQSRQLALKEYKDYSETQGNVKALISQLDRLSELSELSNEEGYFSRIPLTEESGEKKRLRASILAQMRFLANEKGVLTDKDVERFADSLPDSFRKDTNEAIKQNIIDTIQTKARARSPLIFNNFGEEREVSDVSFKPEVIEGKPLPEMTSVYRTKAGETATQNPKKYAQGILGRLELAESATIEDVQKAGGQKLVSELQKRVKDPKKQLEIIVAATEAEKETGIPHQLLLSVAATESRFDPNAESHSGAKGMYQFIKSTGKQYGLVSGNKDERNNVFKSTMAAANYLKDLIDQFDGNVGLALAAYNGGPELVRKALEKEQSSIRQ